MMMRTRFPKSHTDAKRSDRKRDMAICRKQARQAKAAQ
jgi:hypothetical protein